MRKTVTFIITIVLACSLVFGMGITTAFADTPNVVLKVTLSDRTYSTGDKVSPAVVVENGYTDSITVTGITCNGSSVWSGSKAVAAGATWGTQPSVTASFGSSTTEALSFVATYTYVDSSSASQSATASAGIQITKNANLSLSVSDSVDDKTINAGDKANFTFTIKNTGDVSITNASLKAPPLNGGDVLGDAFSLDPGGSVTKKWSEKINKSITVKPVLSYTANSTNATKSLDSISITVTQAATNSGMTVALTADKSTANAGDQVTITATITNSGSDALTGIKLLDGNGNAVTTQDTSLDAGKSTTATIPETVQATANYQFSASATNSAGTQVNATSNQLTINVGSASASPSASSSSGSSASSGTAALTIQVVADAYALDNPGNVKFQVTIQNTSNVLLSNVAVTEKTLGDIGTISAMGTDTKTFTKTATVDKTSQYTFTVTATQPDGKTITAVTKPLSITVKGGSLFGGDMWSTILIIVIIAIAVVGVVLFLLYRRNRSGGGFGGGQPKSYTANRKPTYNSAPKQRDIAPPKAPPVRKPISPAPKPPAAPKNTKFGDRNKF